MAKRRRSQKPLDTPRLTKWNATAAQAKVFAKERKLKNRIHELEQELLAVETVNANLISAVNDAKREADFARPSTKRIVAMERFARLPMLHLVEHDLVVSALELANWALELQGKRKP